MRQVLAIIVLCWGAYGCASTRGAFVGNYEHVSLAPHTPLAAGVVPKVFQEDFDFVASRPVIDDVELVGVSRFTSGLLAAPPDSANSSVRTQATAVGADWVMFAVRPIGPVARTQYVATGGGGCVPPQQPNGYTTQGTMSGPGGTYRYQQHSMPKHTSGQAFADNFNAAYAASASRTYAPVTTYETMFDYVAVFYRTKQPINSKINSNSTPSTLPSQR